MSVSVVPNGNGKNEDQLAKYENNLGNCPSPQQRYISVTNSQVQVIDKVQYCGIQTASLNNYYGHDDVRAIFMDKAPWNWRWFYLTIIFLVVGIVMLTDENRDDTKLIVGLSAMGLFLIYLIRFTYQFMRPKVNTETLTTRWKECPLSWGGQSEPLTFIGRGPSMNVKSADDIGVGILSKMMPEEVISEHWGRKEKGVSIRVILTNNRINIRRSKLCCCSKIVTEDALETWKLEDVTSVSAEQSFPLWWILATVWAILVLIVHFATEDDEALKKDQDFQTVKVILWCTVGLFFILAGNATGGIGYCRKAFITVYFKSPMWMPFMFVGARTSIELPRGAAQGLADGIAKAIIASKDAKIASTIADKLV